MKLVTVMSRLKRRSVIHSIKYLIMCVYFILKTLCEVFVQPKLYGHTQDMK